MHPYEMLAVMRQRELTTVIKVNQSSLYSVIEALLREKWIEPLETQREGRYPERTVYATNEAGRAELIDWLRSLIRRPAVEYTQFAAGLALLGNLSPDEVAALLKEHLEVLDQQISVCRTTLARAEKIGVDRVFVMEDLYSLTLLEAKHGFLAQLVLDINNGTVTMFAEGKRVWKVTRPDLAALSSEQLDEYNDSETGSSTEN
ncbi:PadR family transcriptional regulator [Dictyobacter alpinus]|uniref:PadR family transcriptional regulator n=2 Tax=Dictyobacter alpinus TaxID=2014873 RepID=A0A402BC47_9CHLR|nr:PadR family transcriptional regulator [Dictyobacter alpinus]